MSNANKFECASFFDANTGSWIEITPAQFNENIHKGRIECETEECHAALSYVSEYQKNANNDDVPEHFKTNRHGEGHSEDCILNPDSVVKTTIGMCEALQAGEDIHPNGH